MERDDDVPEAVGSRRDLVTAALDPERSKIFPAGPGRLVLGSTLTLSCAVPGLVRVSKDADMLMPPALTVTGVLGAGTARRPDSGGGHDLARLKDLVKRAGVLSTPLMS